MFTGRVIKLQWICRSNLEVLPKLPRVDNVVGLDLPPFSILDAWHWSSNFPCRLLGANTAADVLQLTHSLTGGRTRFHFFTNDDIHMTSRPEDDLFDDLFQVGDEDGNHDMLCMSSLASCMTMGNV